METSPTPGTHVPLDILSMNKMASGVSLKAVLEKYKPTTLPQLPACIGMLAGDEPIVVDLAKNPHLMIASSGREAYEMTRTILTSLIVQVPPSEMRFVILDTIGVNFSEFRGIAHAKAAGCTPQDVAPILSGIAEEFHARVNLFRAVGVKNINQYNTLGEGRIRAALHACDAFGAINSPKIAPLHLPRIVLVCGDLADIMLLGSENESLLVSLLQKGRAAGIHLIATCGHIGHASLTGMVRANIPCKICFKLDDNAQSRLITDTTMATDLKPEEEILVQTPDMEWEYAIPCRIADDEVWKVVSFLQEQQRA